MNLAYHINRIGLIPAGLLFAALLLSPRGADAADFPVADKVVVRYVPDVSNLVTQLLAGDIDYVEGIPPRDAARLGANADLTLIPFDYPAYDYLGWNGARAPFDDPEVRRALTLALDQ